MKQFTIDGRDFSAYFTPCGMKIQYPKIRGKNSGQMLDGTYTDDVVRTKAVIQQTCMPLTTEQAATLLSVVARTYVDVYYFDPRSNGYRSVLCMPSEPDIIDRGNGPTGDNYWTGVKITFTER